MLRVRGKIYNKTIFLQSILLSKHLIQAELREFHCAPDSKQNRLTTGAFLPQKVGRNAVFNFCQKTMVRRYRSIQIQRILATGPVQGDGAGYVGVEIIAPGAAFFNDQGASFQNQIGSNIFKSQRRLADYRLVKYNPALWKD